jgi:hypothetical protein
VIEALIPWVKRTDPKRSGLETVLMGRIRIQDRKLTAEVNSAGRAKAFRALVEKTPGLTALPQNPQAIARGSDSAYASRFGRETGAAQC